MTDKIKIKDYSWVGYGGLLILFAIGVCAMVFIPDWDCSEPEHYGYSSNYTATGESIEIMIWCGILMVGAHLFMTLLGIFNTKIQKLAEHDFNNDYKDEDLYTNCEQYREKYDCIQNRKTERKENEARKNLCVEAFNKRVG